MDEATTSYLVCLWRAIDSVSPEDGHHGRLLKLFAETCAEQGLDVATTRRLLLELDASGWLRKERRP